MLRFWLTKITIFTDAVILRRVLLFSLVFCEISHRVVGWLLKTMHQTERQTVHTCVLRTVFSFDEMCGTHISHRQKLRSSE